MGETVNTKPDPPEESLCNCCGNPLNLTQCSACRCARYCSKDCQREEWTKGNHKRACKEEKVLYATYQKELETNKPDPNRFVEGPVLALHRFDPDNLRFPLGQPVEAHIGCTQEDSSYAKGAVVKHVYKEENMERPAAYQVELDPTTCHDPMCRLIYAPWDDDHFARALPEPAPASTTSRSASSAASPASATASTSMRKLELEWKRQMEFVD